MPKHRFWHMLSRAAMQLHTCVRPLYCSIAVCCVAGLSSLAVVVLVIWPAYKDPSARMFTSKLGYAEVLRNTGGASRVKATKVQRREIIGKFIGEGLTQSEPVQVPMIAMARIEHVNAIEGQRVRAGDVLVQLDQSKIQYKIQSARAALQTAQAELERVRFGTVNVLQEERPELIALKAEVTAAESEMREQLLSVNRKLRESDLISAVEYAESQFAAKQAELLAKQNAIAAEMAIAGRESSITIANAAIREAELTLAYRLAELEDYTSASPTDGIVERVLVHEGEYNQDPGRPAILLASGLWFECYLDQTALGRVFVGDRAEVRLSAHQAHVFTGRVSAIRPLVNFALGGPETNRPMRPLGTGAPEWLSTFSVRIRLDETAYPIVPGLTGYASVIQRRNVLAVPRGTVSAVSGRRGIVYVIADDNTSFQPRNVVTGITDGQWVEIKEGLAAGEQVISDGYQVLQPGDEIVVNRFDQDSLVHARTDVPRKSLSGQPHRRTIAWAEHSAIRPSQGAVDDVSSP